MLFLSSPKYAVFCKTPSRLDEQGVCCTLRDIKDDQSTEAELRGWHRRRDLPLRRFCNAGSLRYGALSLKDRLPTMTEDAQLALPASGGMSVRRLMLIGKEAVFVGFKQTEREALVR